MIDFNTPFQNLAKAYLFHDVIQTVLCGQKISTPQVFCYVRRFVQELFDKFIELLLRWAARYVRPPGRGSKLCRQAVLVQKNAVPDVEFIRKRRLIHNASEQINRP